MSGSITACSRLQRECRQLMLEPIPYISASPLPHDLLDWRYVITGPPATPFEGGVYYGKLVFSPEYPFKPPSIYMMTPNGRFKVNKRLCFSMSDFHPSHWDPAWTVSNIILGILSFMVEETPTYGSMETSTEVKQEFARQSLQFNVEKNDEWFPFLFPDIFARCSLAVKSDEEDRSKEEEPNTKSSSDVVVDVPEEDVVVRPKHCACQHGDVMALLFLLLVLLGILFILLLLIFVLVC